MALMIGTAGLPHVIVRFFTVPKVSDARKSAGYALLFIALIYTTAPAVGAFARINFIDNVHNAEYTEIPAWFKSWEDIGLIGWEDKNDDGKIQYSPGAPFQGKPTFAEQRREDGSRQITNAATDNTNEVYVDRDIMVLANPEIAALPAWVIALVAAGGLAAALSTAAGLLLVISTAISHDLLKKTFAKGISDKQELFYARVAAATAIGIAGYLGIDPPGFVAQVVAFAFGLAAASLFPAILLGIFDRRMNKEGAITGMLAGLVFSFSYIAFFKFVAPEMNTAEYWLFGISPEGIGSIGAVVNFTLAFVVSRLTPDVPAEIVAMVNNIRIPKGVNKPSMH
jgi:cation/acetate symporter